jgi:hypothetical protein
MSYSIFSKELGQKEIDAGIEIAKELTRVNGIVKAYGIIEELVKAFSTFSTLELGINRDLLKGLRFVDCWQTAKKVKVASIYVASLFSVNIGVHRYFVKHISKNKTKNGNFVHTLRNGFGVEFCIALSQKVSLLKESTNEPNYDDFDLNEFIIHPCSESKRNWLFIKSDSIQSQKCRMCNQYFFQGWDRTTNNSGPNVILDSNITEDEFNTFVQINLEKLKNSIGEEFDSKFTTRENYEWEGDDKFDPERGYFEAMTDGQLGDYDDFIERSGDIDDIDTWSTG